MKVKELIELLQQLDPEALALVDGYEGGVGCPSHPIAVNVKLNVNSEWYYGPHETSDDEPGAPGVLIPRA
jgi:hypothetical protein